MGPFLPQGAAKNVSRPMYKGKPRPTGVFDAQTIFPPTKFAEMYHQGDLPCRVDLKGGDDDDEDKKPGGPPGGRAVLWTTPIKQVDLEKYFPIFVEGLREQVEPLIFLSQKALDEVIASCNIKTLLANLRGIIYPLKDNLRTLDDEICVKTLNVILKLAKRSDKIAEAFVPHFPIILPSVDLLRNKCA
jgi:hypothetical protein